MIGQGPWAVAKCPILKVTSIPWSLAGVHFQGHSLFVNNLSGKFPVAPLLSSPHSHQRALACDGLRAEQGVAWLKQQLFLLHFLQRGLHQPGQ